jgi:hypothetical protein
VTAGASIRERGIRSAPFVRRVVAPLQLPQSQMIYSAGARSAYRFTGQGLNEYQDHFIRKTFQMLEQSDIPVALVNIPLWTERHSSSVTERLDWPAILPGKIEMLGIPPATLFRGLTDADIDALYYNDYEWPNHHFNRNGNEFFTRTIAPALIHIYDKYN